MKKYEFKVTVTSKEDFDKKDHEFIYQLGASLQKAISEQIPFADPLVIGMSQSQDESINTVEKESIKVKDEGETGNIEDVVSTDYEVVSEAVDSRLE